MVVMQVDLDTEVHDVKLETQPTVNMSSIGRVDLWKLPRQWNTAIVRRYLSHVLAKSAGSGNIGYGKEVGFEESKLPFVMFYIRNIFMYLKKCLSHIEVF